MSERLSEINTILSFLRVAEDRQFEAQPSCWAFSFMQMTRFGSEAKSVVASIKAVRSLVGYAMRVWGT